MKFAKELERDAVPEWRIKYLNYKAGKKYVKAVARAVHRTSATPRSNNEQAPSYYTARSDAVNSPGMSNDNDPGDSFIERTTSAGARSIPASKHGAADEGQALNKDGGALQYGSFVATPPLQTPDLQQQRTDSKDSFFELPAPAMNPGGPVHGTQAEPHEVKTQADALKTRLGRDPARRSLSSSDLPPRHRTFNGDNPNKRSSSGTVPPPQGGGGLRRLLSQGPGLTPRQQMRNGFMMQSFDLVRERERDFYDFMDSELDKVETFYEMKENQAGKRLSILKEQLHEMRNRRINELARARQSEDDGDGAERRGSDNSTTNGWVRPIKAKMFPPGPNSKAMQFMPRTPRLGAATQSDAGRDYSRRPEDDEVSYRTAKRKLKLALQEFYRGLELLKSYALLNRTAFRKINKKFDKAANARPPYRFMNEKVNKAWFVNSDVLEGHIKAVEDLYARYFERGNHKLAAGKLRSLVKKHGTYASSTFQSGFLVGTGLVFSIQGLVYGVQVLFTEDHDLRQETSYLLQIYGGYFLMLLLFSLFCVNCFFWSKNKINYPFIFEFDQRHSLTWSQLSEFPSFFFLLFGIFFWANFSGYGPESLYLWYPVILIAITVVIIFLPAPVLAHRSRRWFLYAHWRLLLAGIYPVEFRDFFLGDIYCSLTYAMSNMELFFCLYRNEWDNPVQCNSNHSRLMGFLAALPPIWRLLQCLRRYRDTRNIFPHLINGGKYTMTILAAVCLSLYRISGSHGNLALFITFSLVNSVYCSIWDLFMDFSLLQAGSRHLGLRDILALKSRWPYYVIMVIDPIIRFAWVFYAIFTHNAQHSTIVSFMVGFVEVVRRGAWALLRVENEHCANVSQYKASRDVPLPYRIEPLMDQASADTSPTITPQREEHAQQAWQAQQQEAQQATQKQQQQQQQQQRQSDQEQGRITGSSTAVASTPGTVRNRKDTLSARTFSRLLAEAHKQDFVKRRKEAGQQGEDEDAARHGQLSDDDDDDDEVESDEHENSSEVRQVADLMRRGEASS